MPQGQAEFMLEEWRSETSPPKAGGLDRVPVGVFRTAFLWGLGLLSQDNLGVSRTGQKKSWILGEDWGGAALPCWVGFF